MSSLARLLLSAQSMDAAPFPTLPLILPAAPHAETCSSHAHTLEVLQHSSLLRAMLVVLKSTLPPPPELGVGAGAAPKL